jgi:hypothetical protein
MTSVPKASRAGWTAFELQTGAEGLTIWAELTGKLPDPIGVDT